MDCVLLVPLLCVVREYRVHYVSSSLKSYPPPPPPPPPMALQPGVGLGLLYNTPPNLSISCSVSYSFIPIFLRSMDTSSSHLIFGLPLRLVAYSFPYICFGIAVCCILSISPSHCILWHFINLTMFSPLITASNSSFITFRGLM